LSLERVLTKLRYDESVSGYALITNDGQPFLAFSLPDETVPIIMGTMEIHSSSLKLMNVMSGAGTVILARVDLNWVLAVLFSPDFSLGLALQRTQDVVSLLEEVDLPPPPSRTTPKTTELAEAVQASASVAKEHVPFTAIVDEQADIPIDEVSVSHGCVVLRGAKYQEATSIDSELNRHLVNEFSNMGVDVLLVVDEERTVFKIAETLARRMERVLEVVKWCTSKHAVTLECPEEQEAGKTEIVEVPLFEGDLRKAKKQHRDVLALCDGERTIHDIAGDLDIPYFEALQSIVPYRGKTVRFIRKKIQV
jgi:predicted regulator of Ras-like GTPase activity (Roadblock/LC7/MglB family)